LTIDDDDSMDGGKDSCEGTDTSEATSIGGGKSSSPPWDGGGWAIG